MQPDAAFFGRKDFQQCAVVRQMIKDLNMWVEIVTISTLRAADGMALSSRNSYLSLSERERSRCIGLFVAQEAFAAGERDSRVWKSRPALPRRQSGTAP